MLEARDAVAAITGQPAVHLNGACSGGIIAAGALGHLAAEGRLGEIASLTLMVAALDNERAGTAAAFAGREVAAAAVADSARRGYVDGRGARRRVHLAAAERPRVELRRQQLPAGQGAAGVRRPVLEPGHRPPRGRPAPRLHPHRARQRASPSPARSRCSARRSTSARVDVDSYVVAGLTDHIIPWENAYRSTQLLGGDVALRALHQRPHPGAGQPARADSRVELPRRPTNRGPTPEAWARSAPTQPGSWWPDYDQWLAARSGELKPAPKRLGGGGFKAWRRRRAPTSTRLKGAR